MASRAKFHNIKIGQKFRIPIPDTPFPVFRFHQYIYTKINEKQAEDKTAVCIIHINPNTEVEVIE